MMCQQNKKILIFKLILLLNVLYLEVSKLVENMESKSISEFSKEIIIKQILQSKLLCMNFLHTSCLDFLCSHKEKKQTSKISHLTCFTSLSQHKLNKE